MKTIALFGGSFDPPGMHHRLIAAGLAEYPSGWQPFFDEVIVYPCGPRPDKPAVSRTNLAHRAEMCRLTFGDLDNVRLDLTDLEQGKFTRNKELQDQFAKEGELWHVVGADIIQDGRFGASLIHKVWHFGAQLWTTLNFLVIRRPGYPFDTDDLPSNYRLTGFDHTAVSSTDIRGRVARGEPINGLVMPAVQEYIERHKLYRGPFAVAQGGKK